MYILIKFMDILKLLGEKKQKNQQKFVNVFCYC